MRASVLLSVTDADPCLDSAQGCRVVNSKIKWRYRNLISADSLDFIECTLLKTDDAGHLSFP